MKKSLYKQMIDAGWTLHNNFWYHPGETMNNRLVEYIQDLLYQCPNGCTPKKPLSNKQVSDLNKIERKYYLKITNYLTSLSKT